MSTLAWIVVASVFGGVLSVLFAAVFALSARASWIPSLISYAIGALLGASFLEILPHAFENGNASTVAATVLAGIFGFFILEKLVLWRHCHYEGCEVHGEEPAGAHAGHSHASPALLTATAGTHAHGSADGHDQGRSGMLILIGDSFHYRSSTSCRTPTITCGVSSIGSSIATTCRRRTCRHRSRKWMPSPGQWTRATPPNFARPWRRIAFA